MAKKILAGAVSGFRRIAEAHFTVGSPVVEITGPNGSGKSSLLLAIESMIVRAAKAGDKPIRTGFETATVDLLIGDGTQQIRFVQTFMPDEKKPGSTTHKIEAFFPTGGKMRGNATTLLRSITRGIVLDATRFLGFDRLAQAQELAQFIPDFDYLKAQAQRRALFEERTEIGRELKMHAEALLKAEKTLPVIPEGLRPVDAIMSDLSEIDTHNARIVAEQKRRAEDARRRDDLNAEAVRLDDEVKRIERQIAGLQDRIADLQEQAGRHERDAAERTGIIMSFDPLDEPRDRTTLQAELAEARGMDAARHRWTMFEEQKADVAKVEAKHEAATGRIVAIDKAIEEATALAVFPIEGLSFSTDGLALYQGEPLDQASAGQRVVIFAALSAAMLDRTAEDEGLRTLIIPDLGATIDAEHRAKLEEIAERHDVSILMEVMREASEPADAAAIVMIEGRSVETPPGGRKPRAKKPEA